MSAHDKAITPPSECTGCALCANVCTHNAISMEWNQEGFLVPAVNTNTCINCGACVIACPAQPKHLEKLRHPNTDVQPIMSAGGWNRAQETLAKSSSGGIFTALAEYIFKLGGCVFGVVWDNKDTAVYTKAENMEELDAMRGSKYVQAIPGFAYRQVKDELKKGRQVLFCGTSCQVYALKRYLKKEYENLLLVDILCHGVPSRHLLQSYIREYEKQQKNEITVLQFRDKDRDWQKYKIKKIFKNGTSISHCNWEDMFMRVFIGDYVLNTACYNCPHAKLPRVGDITLGDFWGNLQKRHSDWPIAQGIASILGNTEKGCTILQKLQNNKTISLNEVPFNELYEGQPYTYYRDGSVAVPPAHKLLLKQLKNKPLGPIYDQLFNQVRFGPFRFKRQGILHRILKKIKSLAHLFTCKKTQ